MKWLWIVQINQIAYRPKKITSSSNAPLLWPNSFSFSTIIFLISSFSTIEKGKISLSEQALIKWPSRGLFLSSVGSWQGRIHFGLSENLVFWYSSMALLDPFSQPRLVRKDLCHCFARSFYSIVITAIIFSYKCFKLFLPFCYCWRIF